jgi:uncharacterized protein (DUF1015 family)
MADVVPFRGLLYNPDKIIHIDEVVTPPYDVISEREQDKYYNRHPYNIIRLDKGKSHHQDTENNNSFTRAAADFKNWMEIGILIRDQAPMFYLTSVEFEMHRKPFLRYGLIARVRLEPFSKGIILPHEKTFSKVKDERFELMKACHANFSPVFSIFSDKSDVFGMLTTASSGMAPVFDFLDDAGHRHKLWRIFDAEIQKMVSDGFKERRLFIADGHHRYETAMNYKQWIYDRQPELPANHPCNFIMMYLCPVQDQGLIILPAHRLLSDIPRPIRSDFLHKTKAYFDIRTFPVDSSEKDKMVATLRNDMKAHPGQHKIGLFIKNYPEFLILSLKSGIMAQFFEKTIEAPLRELDVTVLTRLILIHLLGFTDEMLDSEQKINFTSSDRDAVAAVLNGTYDIAFILNPTTNDQVRKIAEQGLTMPRKSTYYYPKAITGLVMNTLLE